MFLWLPGPYPYLGPQEATVLLTPCLARLEGLGLVLGVRDPGERERDGGLRACWLPVWERASSLTGIISLTPLLITTPPPPTAPRSTFLNRSHYGHQERRSGGV